MILPSINNIPLPRGSQELQEPIGEKSQKICDTYTKTYGYRASSAIYNLPS